MQPNTSPNAYLDYEGIKGNVTSEGFKDLIAIRSIDWSVSRQLRTVTGTAQDREASPTTLGDITITKDQDIATTKLFEEATIGQGKKAVFHIVKQGSKVEKIMTIELTDAMISSFQTTIDGDRPLEIITISYTEMMMSVTPTDDKGMAQGQQVFGYSAVKGEKM